MAKSQKRSNREAKKPKQVKVAAPVVADSLFARSNLSSAPPTKKRP
jgi:hypothetical protein